jgi:hypothetical protein
LPVSPRPELLLPFERVGIEREEELRDGVRMGVVEWTTDESNRKGRSLGRETVIGMRRLRRA